MKYNSTAKPFDYVVILAVILLAAVSFFAFTPVFSKDTELRVLIHTKDGDSYYDINENKIIPIESNGFHIKVEIYNGAVRVYETDCPNKYCKDSGEITKKGQIIICAPALLYIKIVGGEVGENEPDIVV